MKFILFLGVLLAGILIGRYTVSSNPSPQNPPSLNELPKPSDKTNFHSLEIDRINAKLLETQNRLMKAQERISILEQEQSRNSDKNVIESSPMITDLPQREGQQPKVDVVDKPNAKVMTKNFDQIITKDKTPEKIEKNALLENGFQIYKKAQDISNLKSKILANMTNSYAGTLEFFDKSETVDVYIVANYTETNGKLEGDFEVSLSTPEKGVFSRSSGNGSNSHFKNVAGSENSIIVKASPTRFFHLFLLENNEIFGISYKQAQQVDQWQAEGRLLLSSS